MLALCGRVAQIGDPLMTTTQGIRHPMAEPAAAGPVQPNDETQLLARLRAGDGAAYETIVRAYGSRMLAIARRYLRCEQDCADAVQEAFVSAFRAIDKFAGTSTLSTWLHRITVNACLMRLRS